MDFLTRIQSENERLKSRDLKRSLKITEPSGLASRVDGGELLNLSSNDYLGLSARPDLADDFMASFCRSSRSGGFPLSAVSSRLLTGNHPQYASLEAKLSSLYARAALAANSGYHANIGVIPALAGAEDLILSDELNHASIIDGIRLSRSERRTFPHLDYDAVERIIAEEGAKYRNIFVITESLFSMDGDKADLRRLAAIRRASGVVLLVDEAHAVGVFGARGLGLAEEAGVLQEVDILIGTFGKALCSAGAFIIADECVRDYLVTTMRPLLYTTGLPPVVVGWSEYTLKMAVSMKAERENLLALGERLRGGLRAKGYATCGQSQIVPIILGASAAAIEMATKLRAKGFLVFPIRPPTVPEGSSRIRVSLHAGLSAAEIDALLAALG